MKYSKYSKITAYILIQVFLMLNFSWAQQENVRGNNDTHTLAPALQISNNAYFLPYYNIDVVKPWNKVNVILKEQRQIEDYFNNTIEVNFKNDQVGIFSKILKAIDRDGKLISFQMVDDKERKLFRFEVITETKKQRSIIIDKIKEIDDLAQENLKKIKKKKWVLRISAPEKGDALKQITAYLAFLRINVSKFLTPKQLGDGQVQFVFELDIPRYLKIDLLKSKLCLLINRSSENVQVTAGQLVDLVLDEFLISEIKVDITTVERRLLRLAVKTVADRHMSQARKDGRVPFLMHPVEIAKILSNEIEIFDPDLRRHFSRSLKLKEEEVVLSILMATILHDAVEDGDVSQEKLETNFGRLISSIVKLVTKLPDQRDKKGEAVYLNNLLKKGSKVVRQIAQIIKIADRIHNLRTLNHNSSEFQRKVVFSTIDNFVPYFIAKINIDQIENEYIKDLFTRTIELFDQQLLITLKDLEIGPQQRIQYEWEEKCRLNPEILRVAEKNNLIAHGISREKGGLDGLFDIIQKGYIKAKLTDWGMTVFAGLLRPQKSDENHDDYQAESPGDYKPFYVILDPVVNDFRIRQEIAKRKVILPGFYRAMPIAQDNWGLGSEFHIAYLVPANSDRQRLTRKMRQSVQDGKIDTDVALKAIAKIITYDEFLAKKGVLTHRTMSAIKKNNINSLTDAFINCSI